MSPDSEGLGALVETSVDSNLTQPCGISHLSLHFFSEVLASVLIPGPNSLLKFVKFLNYNNISKPQYSVDPESSLYLSAQAHQKIYPILQVIHRSQA